MEEAKKTLEILFFFSVRRWRRAGPRVFLSAAQPTDQGEESVVLVVAGGTIFQFPMYSFLGCEKAKTVYIMVHCFIKNTTFHASPTYVSSSALSTRMSTP